MLQSNLHFCPYIQCVCFRISKKTGGNQDINSMFVFSSPMYKCQVAAHYHKADRSRTANETVVCVFDGGVVKGSALTKQREQKQCRRRLWSSVLSGPGSQCQG